MRPVHYITVKQVREHVEHELVQDKSDAMLEIQIDAAREMIDARCQKVFPPGRVPALVKSVNLDLVRLLLQDVTKSGETVRPGDYSYTRNSKAFAEILDRLNMVDVDGETVASRANVVKVRVV